MNPNILKIAIGPVICGVLLFLMGVVGFFMFKKKYVFSPVNILKTNAGN